MIIVVVEGLMWWSVEVVEVLKCIIEVEEDGGGNIGTRGIVVEMDCSCSSGEYGDSVLVEW